MMLSLFDFFTRIDEHFAAGLFKNPNGTFLQRHADALTQVLDMGTLPKYKGTKLYPVGKADFYFPNGNEVFGYFYPYSFRTRYVQDKTALQQLLDKAEAVGIHIDLPMTRLLNTACSDNAFNRSFRGWTHSIVNFKRILNEGLKTYARRITANMDKNPQFYGPLLQVLTAIQNYIRRCETYLRKQNATQLADAFHQMIQDTPRNLYEAFVFYNFFWFIDGSDDGGRMDDVLMPYVKDESQEEISQLFRECWLGFFENLSWHATFDSKLPLLAPALLGQRGLNRPNTSILIDDDTSDDAWNAIFDSWDSGNTNPSLYFRANYLRALAAHWNVSPEDARHFAFGGCTETMVQGCSNVGSTDGHLRVLRILDDTPLQATSFDDFYARLLENIREQAKQAVTQCELGHTVAQTYQPNVIRTIFIDDCIDTATEFNAGGARYNSGLIGVVGLSNLVNALYNIRCIYNGEFASIQQLEDALKANFEGYDDLRQKLLKTPKFGNDDDGIDALATRVIHDVFDAVLCQSRPHRFYFPFINLFTTYGNEGMFIHATADGRLAGAPVGDSFGAVQGTDLNGPTALLKSVTKPVQHEALGTPIVNLRLAKAMLATPEKRRLTKSLLMAYFHRGGMQIQVTILDSKAMLDALEHPENHKDLMVRIGGYSEYFINLTPSVQLEVIKRSEHLV